MCGADLWGRPSACGGLPGRLSAMLLAGSLARDALYHGRFPAQQSDRETSLSHLCRGRADSRLSLPSLAKTHRGKPDRKSTRLNSSHLGISYAVFCLKKNTIKFNDTAITMHAQCLSSASVTTTRSSLERRALQNKVLVPDRCLLSIRRLLFFF